METKTKIICTMGPSCNTLEKISDLIDAGMNVARLNFSHGSKEEHAKTIALLKQARREKNVALAIMLDTKGPEIRVGALQGGQIPIEMGTQILLVRDSIEGTLDRIQITPPSAIDALEEGMTVLFDDGYLSAEVKKTSPQGATIEFLNNGILKSQKGVNLPNAKVIMPPMTDQDREDLRFGAEMDVDCVAASFICSSDHLLEIKKFLISCGKRDILVLAKIENSLGVAAFDEILKVSDGIMVARGDLGVELPLNVVPRLQKMMIRKCRIAGKPVITATQMLESMIKNPRPTRAEVSDVANAIYDATSCVMLSGETAMGAYPIEAVKMMKSIIAEAEKDFPYLSFFEENSKIDFSDTASAIALAAVKTAYSIDATAIFASTKTGTTAKLISRFRPHVPIFSISPSEKIYHQMALVWGVLPVFPATYPTVDAAVKGATQFAVDRGVVEVGDRIVLTAGTPFGKSGTTNTMVVQKIAPLSDG